MKKAQSTNSLKELAMIIPNSFMSIIRPVKERDLEAVPPIDDPDIYKPVLYSISSVLVFKALSGGVTKAGLIKSMIAIHGGDTSKAAASLATISASGALLEFAVGPLFGKVGLSLSLSLCLSLCLSLSLSLSVSLFALY